MVSDVFAGIGAAGGLLGGIGALLSWWKSAKATEIARCADARSERAEIRQTERSDVEWRGRWGELGIWQLWNVGYDTAFDVIVIVVADGTRYIEEREAVARDQAVEVDVSAERSASLERLTSAKRAMERGGSFYAASATVSISARMLWRTEAGAPREDSQAPQSVRVN